MSFKAWEKFATNNYRFMPKDPDYRRVYLLNSMLAVLVVISLLMLILNIVFFTALELVILNGFGVVFGTAVMVYFHRTDRLDFSGILTTLLLFLILLSYFNIKEYRDYAFYWMVMVPPVSYFLLGRKKGRTVTLVFFAYMTVFIATRYVTWDQDHFSRDAVFNLLFTLVALTAVIAYYEVSRHENEVSLQEKNEKLAKLSTIDPLTGLYNRYHLGRVLGYEIGRSERSEEPFSVIIGDLDWFKKINDTWGHAAGDRALTEVAGIIFRNCRQCDTVGRWGGEEFLLICPGTDTKGAAAVAERIREKIEKADLPVPGEITVSLGISAYIRGDSRESLLARADCALYRAKEKGRNRVEL